MTVFYWTLFSTYLLGLVSRINRGNKKPLFIGTFLVALILIVVAGARSGIGDTYMYRHLYEMIIDKTYTTGYEEGFVLFLSFLATISQDSQFMIIITSIITHGINVFVMSNYSSYFELELYMYIASGFFLTSMNGIRQAMAASIVFLGTVFLVKRKFIPYAFLVFIATSLHTSAIIMIFVYFIVNNDFWTKHFKQIVIVGVLIILFGSVIASILFKILSHTRYGSYDTFEEGGANIIRTLIAFVPVILAYLQKDNLRKIMPNCDIFVNLSILNFFVMALSIDNWIFARMSYYFQLYSFILLPYTIKSIADIKQKRFIYYSFLLAYFIFMYVEYKVTQNVTYKSNVLTLFAR